MDEDVQGEEARGEEARAQVFRLLSGVMAARTVTVAVELGLVDLIGEGECTPAELAADIGTQPRATHRLLRALAALGMLAEPRAGTFTVTGTGALLGEKHPQSLAAMVRVFGDPVMLRAWDRLEESVRTGETAFDTLYGTDFFSHLKTEPKLSAQFNAAMSEATLATAEALPSHFDFSRFSTVVDVGGGDGTLLTAILRAHPALRGIVYDTAEGLAQADGTFEAAGLGDRAATVQGDFFASAPGGGDLYLLKSVIHDWNDEQCATILRHIRAVLPPHGRLLIVEPVLPERVEPGSPGLYLSDLNMLVNVGGRERTREDFTALCETSGFAPPAFDEIPPPVGFHMIEAAPR